MKQQDSLSESIQIVIIFFLMLFLPVVMFQFSVPLSYLLVTVILFEVCCGVVIYYLAKKGNQESKRLRENIMKIKLRCLKCNHISILNGRPPTSYFEYKLKPHCPRCKSDRLEWIGIKND